jgi:protein tyrosine phosphatase (PTP) superfamily phosphohydrolase (DUF442 family)
MEPQQPPVRTTRFSRRKFFRLIGAGTILAFVAETGRVLFGSNEHAVIPGKVFRSAQLSQEKLERTIADKQIKTVINLRGLGPDQNWYVAESRATHAMGVSQEDITLSAKRFPPQSEILRLIEVLDRTEYPVLIHCAQGADRTGLASTIVLLLYTHATLAEARCQLSPRYGHFAFSRTGVLDQFFDYYQSWLQARVEQHTPERFRLWAKTAYCPGPFRAGLEVISPRPLEFRTGRGFIITFRATNRAVEPWHFTTGATGGIKFRYALYRNGDCIYRGQCGNVARIVLPGESIDFDAGFPPVAAPMQGMLWADMLDSQPIELLETDFVQYGSEGLMQTLTVKE